MIIKALSDAYRKRTGDYGRVPRLPMSPADRFVLIMWLLFAAGLVLLFVADALFDGPVALLFIVVSGVLMFLALSRL